MNQAKKVALITGGAGGIGRGLVEAFAAAEYQVVSVDKHKGKNFAQVNNIEFDLSDVEKLDQITNYCLDQFESIDVLINNAAVSLGKNILQTDVNTWDQTIAINVTAPFFLSKLVSEILISQKKSGAIVNMASVNSFAAEKGHASYVASKGAIAAMTKSMAIDLAEHNIRVNAIAPGPIVTEKTSAVFSQPDYASAIKKGIPFARAGTPQEVADLALFLTSHESKYITGQVITIDGGYLSYARLD